MLRIQRGLPKIALEIFVFHTVLSSIMHDCLIPRQIPSRRSLYTRKTTGFFVESKHAIPELCSVHQGKPCTFESIGGPQNQHQYNFRLLRCPQICSFWHCCLPFCYARRSGNVPQLTRLSSRRSPGYRYNAGLPV